MSVSAVVEVLKALGEIFPRSGGPKADFAAIVEVVEADPRLAVSGALELSSEKAILDFDAGI